MTTARYHVRVTKDHLVFSAAHFITFNGNICERLHGHNWRLAVEVAGPLDENHYVFDFIALRDATQKLVNELDHHVLLPTKHEEIRVTADEREVTATFAERRWGLSARGLHFAPGREYDGGINWTLAGVATERSLSETPRRSETGNASSGSRRKLWSVGGV